MRNPLITWRRDRLLAPPFPDEWRDILRRNVSHYAYLTADERTRLENILRVVKAEKRWEAAGGLATLTDEITVTIAAQAALLLLGMDEPHYFPNLQTVIVYPAAYRVRDRATRDAGIVDETNGVRLGEAWSTGQVVLSWDDAQKGGQSAGDGHNLVLHEFAHTLDQMDGDSLGTPVLGSQEEYDQWYAVMNREFSALRRATWERRPTVLQSYGAENAAEFFAVATEAFFETPRALRRRHRALYAALCDFYGQNPAARILRYLRTNRRGITN